MILKKNKAFAIFFLYLFIILLFTKIDYRFVEEIPCCQDDHDYYSHSETIAIDFDLDYSNQYIGFEKERYYKNNVIAPRGFVGSGLLASPFLFAGDLLDKNLKSKSMIFNYRILFYSVSALFYFFLSIYLLNISFKYLKLKTNLNYLFLLFMGSGMPYFVFERYSMTHVYEVFTISLVIYLVIKFYTYKTSSNYFSFLIPIATILAISVRWVNYHVLFIPFILKILFNDKFNDKNKLINNYFFYLSYFASTGMFLILNKAIYGVYTINPAVVYGGSNKLNYFLEMGFLKMLKTIIFSMLKIMFTKEFGIFWFSPILFIALCFLFYFSIISKKHSFFNYFFILIIFGIPFSTVVLWQSTASSYGFRYLYSLLPLAILIFAKWSLDNKNIILNNYLFYFSIFSSLSIIFFETTSLTSLSQNINTFGIEERFSQPNYLIGYLKSVINIEAYLKIFTTSFLGVIFFKLLFSFFPIDIVNNLLKNLNLPVENEDYISFISNLESVSGLKIFIFSFTVSSIVYFFTLKIQKTNSSLSKLYLD